MILTLKTIYLRYIGQLVIYEDFYGTYVILFHQFPDIINNLLIINIHSCYIFVKNFDIFLTISFKILSKALNFSSILYNLNINNIYPIRNLNSSLDIY